MLIGPLKIRKILFELMKFLLFSDNKGGGGRCGRNRGRNILKILFNLDRN